MEILYRYREKDTAFQQRGTGKWRFMQPARRPVIANRLQKRTIPAAAQFFTLHPAHPQRHKAIPSSE
jgi:hypothetical protein